MSERLGWAGLVTIIVIILGVMSVVISDDAASDAAKSAREASLKVAAQQLQGGCPRNQLNRAWQRIRSLKAPSVRDSNFNQEISESYFRVTDCEATYAIGYTGPPVYLTPALDACFVRLTADGFWVRREPFTTPAKLEQVCRSTG